MNTPLESNLTKAYEEAYRLGREKIVRCDPVEVCQNSKAVFEKATNTLVIRYFNAEYRVAWDSGAVCSQDAPGEPTITEKVLILHYLTHAQPKPLSGKTISFREVPGGGALYYPAFKRRALDPLIKVFGDQISSFKEAAVALSGVPEKYGTVSSTLYAFPFVPITYVLWQGDAELPASGAILFDAAVVHFLPVEDIVLAGSYGAYRLIKESQKG
jgi:hypothetical protein